MLSRLYQLIKSMGQRQWLIIIAVILALIAYIAISYYNWQQNQMALALASQEFVTHAIDKLQLMSTKGHGVKMVEGFEDGIKDIVCNATPIYTKLKWEHVIQPGSADERTLLNRIQVDYLALMNSQNIAARGKDTLDELQYFMSRCCLEVTKDEFNYVDKKLRAPRISNKPSIARILQGYLNYWVPKIHLAKSRNGLEYNMPHTHSTTMMMPAGWWKAPDYSTFIHEMAHIHQRAHPYEWMPLYEDKWHFKYVPNLGTQVRGLDTIIVRSRLNPDGSDFNWLWLGAKDGRARWIGAIFPHASTVSNTDVALTNVDYVSVPLDKVGDTWTLSDQYRTTVSGLPLLANDVDFMQFFGLKANNYHPNELGAQMMETWSDNIGPGTKPRPAMKAFDKWLQELPWIMPKYD